MQETPNYLSESDLIKEILIACKASGTHSIDEVFMSLAFCTQSELIKIASELNIKTTKGI